MDPNATITIWESPYALCGNNPISVREVKGLTGVTYIEFYNTETKTTGYIMVTDHTIEDQMIYVKIEGTMSVTQTNEGPQINIHAESIAVSYPGFAPIYFPVIADAQVVIGKEKDFRWPGIVVWGSGGETGGRKASKIIGTFDYAEIEALAAFIGGEKSAKIPKGANPYNKGEHKNSKGANKQIGKAASEGVKSDGKGTTSKYYDSPEGQILVKTYSDGSATYWRKEAMLTEGDSTFFLITDDKAINKIVEEVKSKTPKQVVTGE